MSTEITVVPLQEKDLELVVSEKTLGSLTTNAKQIKELVSAMLPKYDIANYSEDNIEAAKKDKALLNNSSKALNQKRIEIEREFNRPFEEFKNIVAETVNLIKECSSKIDTVVKQSEQKAKEEKKAKIQALWKAKDFSLVALDKVFDDKWLNKTVSEKSIKVEIDTIVSKIESDLATLGTFTDDVELLKPMYLDKLDLSATLQHANLLKQNRERLKEVEKPKPVAASETPSTKEPQVSAVSTPDFPTAPNHPAASQADELLTRAFKVTATKAQLIALGDFMNTNGIQFEKVAL